MFEGVIGIFGFIASGFFAITLSRTFLANIRAKALVSFIIFLALSFVLAWVTSKVNIASYGTTQHYLTTVTVNGIYLALNYAGTIWLLRKKISL